jgi:hypothetical protein
MVAQEYHSRIRQKVVDLQKYDARLMLILCEIAHILPWLRNLFHRQGDGYLRGVKFLEATPLSGTDAATSSQHPEREEI